MLQKSIAYVASFLLLCPLLNTAEPNTVVATVKVGDSPATIGVTPDNRYAYVPNSNNDNIPGGSTVSVIDLATNTVIATIIDPNPNGEPYTVTINPAGTKAYVTNSFTTEVFVIDIATNTVINTIPGFNGPSGCVITPNGAFAYVNNYGAGMSSGTGNTINIVDLTANAIVGTINVDLAPASLAITPDGAYVYVIYYVDGNPGTGIMDVIQTSTNTVVDRILGFSGPFGIAITPNGKYAYVSNFGSNNFNPVGTTVSVVDLSNNSVIATIPVGIQPAGLAITPDGCLVYVAIYDTLYLGPNYTNLTPAPGTLKIISTRTNTLLPVTINVGHSPHGITISPDGKFGYVSNYTDNTVSVVSLLGLTTQGCAIQNKFLSQTDLINQITLTPPIGTSCPICYSIFRDAKLTNLAGTVRGGMGPTVFLDHNVQSHATYTYYVVGTYATGTKSDLVKVVISQ